MIPNAILSFSNSGIGNPKGTPNSSSGIFFEFPSF
jgi:hypothetical protein